jgi:DNA polymerase-3 subunit gamma/tau
VIDAEGNTVTLGVAPSLAKRLAEERNVTAIAGGLEKVVGGSWKIVVRPNGARAEQLGATSPGTGTPRRDPPPSEPDPRDDADYDPQPAAGTVPPLDPEAQAMQLLRDELGARPLES